MFFLRKNKFEAQCSAQWRPAEPKASSVADYIKDVTSFPSATSIIAIKFCLQRSNWVLGCKFIRVPHLVCIYLILTFTSNYSKNIFELPFFQSTSETERVIFRRILSGGCDSSDFLHALPALLNWTFYSASDAHHTVT